MLNARFALPRSRRALALPLLTLIVLLLFAAGREALANTRSALVYGDALASAWEVDATRVNFKLDNSSPTYEGNRSLRVQFHGGDSAFTLRQNGSGADAYQTLQFAIYGLEQNRRLVLTLTGPAGDTLHRQELDVPHERWSNVEITFAAPGQSDVVAAITLQKAGTRDRWDDFYLDQITLVAVEDDAPPTATSTPTTAATLTVQPTATGTQPPPSATATSQTTAAATTQATATATRQATATATRQATATPGASPTAAATTAPPSPTPTATTEPDSSGFGPSGGIWISAAEIRSLPNSGTAWQNVLDWAGNSAANPNIADQNDNTDAVVVAKALVYVRTGQTSYRDQAAAAIMESMGTESGAGILAVARNLGGYVVAADLVGLDGANDAAFRAWLDDVRYHVFTGAGPDLSLITCHEKRPNNFGTHCGASRLLAALYLGDQAELQRSATVFRGWLGDRGAYAGFNFGADLSWQCDPNRPVGINPTCSIEGHPVGGVLPDDQRRAGSFTWPPPNENYVWEALQGAVAQARILERHGYTAFGWSDGALLRAVTWLYQEANFPASGDDAATPWLINDVYGVSFPTISDANPGKNGLGWYEWFSG